MRKARTQAHVRCGPCLPRAGLPPALGPGPFKCNSLDTGPRLCYTVRPYIEETPPMPRRRLVTPAEEMTD